MPQPSIAKIRLKITYLNFDSNFTGANELIVVVTKLFILVIGLVEKNGRTVKQSSDLKTSSIPLQSLEAQLSSLSLVVVLLILFVCHVHSGSHQYSWFSRISSTVANR